jgi:hypothetical protein
LVGQRSMQLPAASPSAAGEARNLKLYYESPDKTMA